MISRGYLIGQIIDDLAILQQKINFRNKIGFLDLTKVCEDFFKEILNIVFDYKLVNLNAERSNEPGLDLADKHNAIAIQITSQKKGDKITETLKKISDENRENYSNFFVFIIGKKQNTYTLDTELTALNNFNKEQNIIDIDYLIKQIAVVDESKLVALHDYFKLTIRNVIVELEPMTEDGDFESSIYNFVETIPNNPPKNTITYDTFYGIPSSLEYFTDLYNVLADIPRAQREYISVIAERANWTDKNNFAIHCAKLANILNMSEEKLFKSLAYLDDISIVRFNKDTDEFERSNSKYFIIPEALNILIKYLRDTSLSIRKVIVGLDFSILEGNE